ncbi:Ribosomal protein S18 acetylase RimI [Friedmanniella luteola]|uniref:Ribosomal protein S18 acetylase RimI n=1 Tax=Friedmanniella luteola TaxID=546871 RepID=A0A1H1M2U4_9ACTN|nr:GNAT family N-acetyltransferase [Friedmanniella luteola]SDR80960.1 Ribosomal protein S18 acetylase RimI [Friedmanniella luteola]
MPAEHDPRLVTLRPVTLDDAEAYVRCHVDCLTETYAAIMPPAFAEQHRQAIPDTVAQTRAAWAAADEQPEPRTHAWLARDPDGEVVGVVRSGPGTQDWERALGAPPTDVGWQLHHLYTRARTHGTGLGRRLLDAAVGDHATYLWILDGNPRADRFYRRHGFAPDGGTLTCGPSWFHRPMYRLVRPPAR